MMISYSEKIIGNDLYLITNYWVDNFLAIRFLKIICMKLQI